MKICGSLRYVSHTSPYTIFDIILDFYECKIYSEQFIHIVLFNVFSINKCL